LLKGPYELELCRFRIGERVRVKESSKARWCRDKPLVVLNLSYADGQSAIPGKLVVGCAVERPFEAYGPIIHEFAQDDLEPNPFPALTEEHLPDGWFPASGGAEKPFKSRSGRTLLYCYNPAKHAHAYLDQDNDIILTDKEAADLMQMT